MNNSITYKLIRRLFRHLFILPNALSRHLSADAMRRIEAAIAQSESLHSGQICFVVEAHLHVFDIFRRKSAKNRAIEIFSNFHVWDTEHNNGVLIYLLLADHDFEILADRGVHQYLGAAGWEGICKKMESMFRQGQFEAGIIQGIDNISEQLKQHYPVQGKNINELANAPISL